MLVFYGRKERRYQYWNVVSLNINHSKDRVWEIKSNSFLVWLFDHEPSLTKFSRLGSVEPGVVEREYFLQSGGKHICREVSNFKILLFSNCPLIPHSTFYILKNLWSSQNQSKKQYSKDQETCEKRSLNELLETKGQTQPWFFFLNLCLDNAFSSIKEILDRGAWVAQSLKCVSLLFLTQ